MPPSRGDCSTYRLIPSSTSPSDDEMALRPLSSSPTAPVSKVTLDVCRLLKKNFPLTVCNKLAVEMGIGLHRAIGPVILYTRLQMYTRLNVHQRNNRSVPLVFLIHEIEEDEIYYLVREEKEEEDKEDATKRR